MSLSNWHRSWCALSKYYAIVSLVVLSVLQNIRHPLWANSQCVLLCSGHGSHGCRSYAMQIALMVDTSVTLVQSVYTQMDTVLQTRIVLLLLKCVNNRQRQAMCTWLLHALFMATLGVHQSHHQKVLIGTASLHTFCAQQECHNLTRCPLLCLARESSLQVHYGDVSLWSMSHCGRHCSGCHDCRRPDFNSPRATIYCQFGKMTTGSSSLFHLTKTATITGQQGENKWCSSLVSASSFYTHQSENNETLL
jgi:hypothetical protein